MTKGYRPSKKFFEAGDETKTAGRSSAAICPVGFELMVRLMLRDKCQRAKQIFPPQAVGASLKRGGENQMLELI
jgi:hypothetical protein